MRFERFWWICCVIIGEELDLRVLGNWYMMKRLLKVVVGCCWFSVYWLIDVEFGEKIDEFVWFIERNLLWYLWDWDWM